MTLLEKALNGYLLVNKPSGPTSYDLIRWVKRQGKKHKIGHTGTLDPLASGLMILLFGKATKKQAEFMGMDKTYACTLRLGQKTDTGDAEGAVTEEKPVPNLRLSQINETFLSFVGAQEQTPPMYSALKVKGQPLYKLARKGKTVERPARPITIHSITDIEKKTDHEIFFRVRCSSGTYVRTLVEDMAEKLGSVGTLGGLCRESIGPYTLENAFPGDDLKSMEFESHLIAL